MPIEQVTESDVYHGLIYAAQSLGYTYDRMRNKRQKDGMFKRFRQIRDGIITEHAVERILNEHCQISSVSDPYKTNWRSPDNIDTVLISSSGRMVDADIKGLRVHDSSGSPDRIRESGHALVPNGQFTSAPKPIYLFAYLFCLDKPSGFSFSGKPKQLTSSHSFEEVNYTGPISIGVSGVLELKVHDDPDVNPSHIRDTMPKRMLASLVFDTQKNSVSEAEDVSAPFQRRYFTYEVIEIDAVYSFSCEVRKRSLTINTRKGRVFLVNKSDWEWGNFGISPRNPFVHLAGWATRDDVREWDLLSMNRRAYPVQRTRITNRSGRVDLLRPISALKEYCESY